MAIKLPAFSGKLPTGYIDGFVCTVTGTWTCSLSAGKARDQADSFDIGTAGALTLSVNSTGAGGRDVAVALGANLSLWVFVIADSTGVNPVAAFADSTTTPSLPAGYDKYVLVWRVLVNSANAALVYVGQAGKGKFAIWTSSVQPNATKSGSFGSPTAIAMTALTGGNVARHPSVYVRIGHIAATGDYMVVFNSLGGPQMTYTSTAALSTAMFQSGGWIPLISDQLFINRNGGSITSCWLYAQSSAMVRGAL